MTRQERRERIAFERWFVAEMVTNKDTVNLPMWRNDSGDGYDDPFLQFAWKGWCASRTYERRSNSR